MSSRYAVTLDSFVVNVVEVTGDSDRYVQAPDGSADFVVRREGREVLRVSRENILYVTISEVPTS